MFFNLNQVQKEILDLVQIRNILNLYQTLFTNPMGPVQNCFEPAEGQGIPVKINGIWYVNFYNAAFGFVPASSSSFS